MKKNHMFAGMRSFLILWGSQAVSSLGTAMTNYALIVWIYGQEGTASSVTQLTLCSFLPTILFRFIAGAIADQWDKKRIMLLSDLLAACGTAAIFALYSSSALEIWHLYAVNFLLSFMNAFQSPAACVATSLLVPREQYARAGGLQAISGSAVTILAPALGSILFARGGLPIVLTLDLASFAVAFCALLSIRLPKAQCCAQAEKESLWQSCLSGMRYLRGQTPLLRIILFFAAVNFLAKIGGDGMMAAFVLGRTGGDQTALGMVQTAVALGLLAGSTLVTLMRPVKSRIRAIFITCGLTFLFGNVGPSLSQTVQGWCLSAFASYFLAAVMNVHLNTVMRSSIPIDLQGRVFSARDTIQNGTIPLGLFLGGLLADRCFEPFMASPSPVQHALSRLFGQGSGSGIAAMFFIAGVAGSALSFLFLKRQACQELDGEPPIP